MAEAAQPCTPSQCCTKRRTLKLGDIGAPHPWAQLGRVQKLRDPEKGTHLLLPKHQHTPWLDGMPRCQVLPGPQLLAILEGLPEPIPCRPGDADMVPLAIADEQGQLSHLHGEQVKVRSTEVRAGTFFVCPSLQVGVSGGKHKW